MENDLQSSARMSADI